MLLAAFLIVMVCSRSSFLYPFNNWDDANCFFTVGKSMLNGIVLYKDIYEQKGPLLYFIYGMAYLMSHTSFIGAFFIEVIFACIYMLAIYKICRLYVDFIPSLAISALSVAVSFSSYAFYFGGSAEELCFPLAAVPTYFLLKCFKDGNGKMAWYKLLISGFCAGCIFLIKYTILSFSIMFVLFVIIEFLRRKNFSGLWKAALLYLGGVAAALFPWIIYFGINGAFKDFYTVYIYNNIFVYGASGGNLGFLTSVRIKIRNYFINFANVFAHNTLFCTLVIVGFFWIIFGNNKKRFSMDKVFVPLTGVAVFLCSFIGGYGYYYALPISLFNVFGLMGIYKIARDGICYCVKKYNNEKAAENASAQSLAKSEGDSSSVENTEGAADKVADGKKKYRFTVCLAAACGAALALSVGGCFLLSMNVSYIGYDKNGLFIYKFAEIIEEKGGGTILNYGALDFGLYTVTDTLPTCKYFCGLNIGLNELKETQDEFISEGRVDFVVCEIEYPENIASHYTLIATDQKRFDDSENTIYLFQKTN